MPVMATECRKLGRAGPEVFPIGLGCMGIGGVYGAASDLECLATIQEAIDAGVNLLDTSDFYGTYRNEMLIGPAIKSQRDRLVLSVKFVPQSRPFGVWLGIAGRQAALKAAVGAAMKKLGVDYIDIYRLGHLDPDAPVEETMATIAEMVQAGYIRHVGLSGLGPETIRRANAMHPIVDLQTEYSLVSRAPEGKVFPKLKELGVAATVYGAASRKLITGSRPALAEDLLGKLSRFKGDHTERNRLISKRLKEIAGDRGITESQLAVAWVLAKQSWIVPLTAARTRAELTESLGALDVHLTAQEISEIEAPILTQAAAETRLDGRQPLLPEPEKAWTRPAQAPGARNWRSAPRDFVDFPTPVRAMSAEDRRFDRRRLGIPTRETVPMLPDETTVEWGSKSRSPQIAPYEPPVRWADADVAPKPVAEFAEADRWQETPVAEAEAPQIPRTVLAQPAPQPAEEVAANQAEAPVAMEAAAPAEVPVLSEDPAASEVPMIEPQVLAEAVAEQAQNAEQAQVPDAEMIETPAIEAPVALHVQPAEDEIAAIEPPAPPMVQPASVPNAEQALEPVVQVSSAPSPLDQNRLQFFGLRGKKSTRRKKSWKQPAEPLIGLHLNPAAEEIPAVEESVAAMAAPEASPEVSQIQIPAADLPLHQPVEATATMKANPAEEEIPACEELIPAVTAPETSLEWPQIEIQADEEPLPQPVEAGAALEAAPAAEEIAAVLSTSVESSEIEIPACEEPLPHLAEAIIAPNLSLAAEASPDIEEPGPVLPLIETSLENSQIETPREGLPAAQAAEATAALDGNQIARLISAIEKLVTAVAVPNTSLENSQQVETQVEELPATQPVLETAVLEAAPAAEEIPVFEEPVFAMAALDTSLENSRIETPFEEQLHALPVEAAVAVDAIPAAEEIAAIEPPVPATTASVENLDSATLEIAEHEIAETQPAEAPFPLEPAPVSVAAETASDAPQMQSPDREKAWTQLAETLGALQEKTARLIAVAETTPQVTETPLHAQAVTESVDDTPQPVKKTESLTRRVSKAASKFVRGMVPGLGSRAKTAPQQEKPRKQPAQAFLSLQLTPPAMEIAAIETPTPVTVEVEMRWNELQPQIVLQGEIDATPIEAAAADHEEPAVDETALVMETAAIEEPLAALEPPASTTVGARTHSNGRKSPILDLARPWTKPAAQAAKHARPTAEEIDAIEAALLSIEPLAPAKAARVSQEDDWSAQTPETEFFSAQPTELSATHFAEPVVSAEMAVAEALVPVQAAADAGDDVLSPRIPEAEVLCAQPADMLAESSAEPAEIAEISAPEAVVVVGAAAPDSEMASSDEFLAAPIPEVEVLCAQPADMPAESSAEPAEIAEISAPEAVVVVEAVEPDSEMVSSSGFLAVPIPEVEAVCAQPADMLAESPAEPAEIPEISAPEAVVVVGATAPDSEMVSSDGFLAVPIPEVEAQCAQPADMLAESSAEPAEIAEISAPEAVVVVEAVEPDSEMVSSDGFLAVPIPEVEVLCAQPADMPAESPAEPAEIAVMNEGDAPVLAQPAAETSDDARPAQMLDSARTWAQLAETLSALRPKPGAEETSLAPPSPLPAAIVTQSRRPSLKMEFLEKEDWSEIHAWATTRHYIGR